MKPPLIPTYEEKRRYMEFACASKRGDSSWIYDREKSKFMNYMHKKYPEWVKCSEKRVFNETVPFGSLAKVDEKNCEDIMVLQPLRHTTAPTEAGK